jgi:hypothetical protein
MPFQWLEMRITEERERRQREADLLARLGPALGELQRVLGDCLKAYTEAFGDEAATLRREAGALVVQVADPPGQLRIATDPKLPGFQVEREGPSLAIEIGLLPGDKLFYRDVATDQFITLEELTRRILDRALFPKLRD